MAVPGAILSVQITFGETPFANYIRLDLRVSIYLGKIDYKIVNFNIKINLKRNNYPELVYKIIEDIKELEKTPRMVYNNKDQDQEKVIKKKGKNPEDYRITEFIVERDKEKVRREEKDKQEKGDYLYEEDRIIRQYSEILKRK